MPCGCGNKVSASGGPTSMTLSGPVPHVYDDGAGSTQEYPTEVQALAAQVRAGGSGTVRPR